jgi:hypothetical protein
LEPGVRFVILHDQDSHDCKNLKADLNSLCSQSGRKETIIRIVCRELESWLLGDLGAIDQYLETVRFSKMQDKAKYRNPDQIGNPSQELTTLLRDSGKVRRARAVSAHMEPSRNTSRSFQVFLKTLNDLKNDQGLQPKNQSKDLQ